MTTDNKTDLLPLVGEITASYVAGNDIAAGDVPALIQSIHAALSGLGAPAPEPVAEKPQGAVSVRKSLANPDVIISMIDGRAYKSLTRHLRSHGLDPKGYRERFGLPADYPMVSKAYSETRRALAQAIGLGRKVEKKVEPPKPARRAKAAPKAEKPAEKPAEQPAAKTRRPRKAKAAA